MKRNIEDVNFYQNMANIASYFFGWNSFVMFDALLGTNSKGETYKRVPWYPYDNEVFSILLQTLAETGLYPTLGWSGRMPDSMLPDFGLPTGWMFLLNRPEGGNIEGFAIRLNDAVYNCLVLYLKHIKFKDVEVKFLRDK